MKKTYLLAAIAAIALAGCGQRVKFDEAAVEVVEAGGNAGVQETEVATGRYWAPPFSYRYIVKFPTTIQTYEWRGARSLLYVNADRVDTRQAISMNVQINPSDADNIVRKYKGAITKNGGEDGYVLDEVVRGPISREMRQAFVEEGNKFSSAQLYADGGRGLLSLVKAKVAAKFAADGIMILDVQSMGPPLLPDNIRGAIQGSQLAAENARKKEAELAATVAEGKKTVAQASAEAQARELAGASIRANPEILKLEEIRYRGRSLCPIGAQTCVIGGSAATMVQGE